MAKKILIAGQGIAGTVLAYTLRAAGAEVYIADGKQFVSSSAIAAGVINPVTGKRYARSWDFDIFYPFAKQFYADLAKEAGEKVWYDYPIIRMLGSPLESNEWNLRAARPEFAGLMDIAPDGCDWEGLMKPGFTSGLLHHAGRVDFEVIMRYVHTIFQQEGRYIAATVDPYTIETWLPEFDHIIFCEGYNGASNPFFPHVPWQSAKGERLLIALEDDRNIGYMLKKQVMLVPVGKNQYWVGANYIWDFTDASTSPEGLEWLKTEIDAMLQCTYTILDHTAAIRPVVKDRRPLVGWSKSDPRIGIFNGTGSKGALLAPYWANAFVQHILFETPIDPVVDVKRYYEPAVAATK